MRRVVWEIDVEGARTPLDAALQAYRAMRKPDTTATVFKVIDEDGSVEEVDLDEMSASKRRKLTASDPLAVAPLFYLLRVEPTGVSLLGPYADEMHRMLAQSEMPRTRDARYYDLDLAAFDVFVAPSES